MEVLVTGAKGFVGKNLGVILRNRIETVLHEYDVENTADELNASLERADAVFHLAGVNRPNKTEDFAAVNTEFTGEICRKLQELGRTPKFILSSSIQAELDNPYGASKRGAEEMVRQFSETTGAEGVIYRLGNLFGKWCRPHYNSVTATFCSNIIHDLPIEISDPSRSIELTHIDDVVAAFTGELETVQHPGCRFAAPLPSYTVTLGELADMLRSFHAHRDTLYIPDYSNPFIGKLYATYLSYLPAGRCDYGLGIRRDDRGSLAEFMKSPYSGQIFISRTRPGITRGNHYHHTKTEKFLIVHGEGIVRLRPVLGLEITEYRIRGGEYRVVDIPPGYTHSIENTGEDDLVTIFWASEVFNPDKPDTFFLPVLPPPEPR